MSEIQVRDVHVREVDMKTFVKRIQEVTSNGGEFVSGRVIGCYLVANFQIKGEVTTFSDEEPLVSAQPVEVPSEEAKPEFSKVFVEACDDKEELELYGRKFGVELSRRKTIKNMRKDLYLALDK